MYLLKKYKNKEQFIFELAQRIDQKYKFNKNEFIYVNSNLQLIYQKNHRIILPQSMHDINLDISIEESVHNFQKKHFLSFQIKSNILKNEDFEVSCICMSLLNVRI